MPFTPIHLGFGAVVKAVGTRRFSFLVFAGSQVLMDLEPLYRMLSADPIVHGRSHTLLGATLIGTVAMLAGKPLSEFALRVLKYRCARISWKAAASGAFVGTYSHVALDAVMHADMQPWWPVGVGNPLLGALTTGALHALLIACGILGGVVVAMKTQQQGSQQKSPQESATKIDD